MNNPCIECGKQRIDGKTWKGTIGSSVVTYIMTVCPDPVCQKIVDKTMADKKERSDLLSRHRLEAKLAKEKLLATS